MRNYYYLVIVTCETREQAEEVMSERIGFDEDYGFGYSIGYEAEKLSLEEYQKRERNER